MKEQEFRFHPERRQLPPKVYEGEILPPLPKPAVMREEPEIQEKIKVIRAEITHYIREQTPPQIFILERSKPEPETIWEEIGGAIADGVAGVRGFIGEMRSIGK